MGKPTLSVAFTSTYSELDEFFRENIPEPFEYMPLSGGWAVLSMRKKVFRLMEDSEPGADLLDHLTSVAGRPHKLKQIFIGTLTLDLLDSR